MERGARVAGRYTLSTPLGAGRGGLVWAADDARDNTRVALKLRHEPVTALDEEIAGLRALEHPHLVRILDAGIDSGVTYVASEILDHGSLADVAKPLGNTALEILAAQMLDALAYLHGHGVLHADIKTENVFVASLDPFSFKLGDFGFAHRLAAGTGLRGSPAFLAPEVIRSEPADERSDLYSLGIVLYECAFGELPFNDSNVQRVLMRHLEETPARLHDPADVSPRLMALMRRLLLKEPAARPADARAALAEWRGEEAGLPTWVPPRLGVLIGRDKEMEFLEQALTGDSVAVAIEGPPGIGKTRLLREFALRAELRGARVEWWTPDTMGPAAETSADGATPNPPQATVLIVDDVDALSRHGRDAASIRVRDTALLSTPRLVCALGYDSVAPFLSEAMAAGDLPSPAYLRLEPWNATAIQEALSALLGSRRIHPELASLVVQATGGLPANVESACRILVNSRSLVRGAHDAVASAATVTASSLAERIVSELRVVISGLTNEELGLLRMVAVLRRPARYEYLLAASSSVPSALETLLRRGLLVQTASLESPRFQLPHAVARDAALRDLSRAERQALHDDVAAILRALDDPVELDHHIALGSNLCRALEATGRIASVQSPPTSPTVLVDLYSALLASWSGELRTSEQHDLTLALIDALQHTGDMERTLATAHALLQESPEPLASEVRLRIARAYLMRGDPSAALGALEASALTGSDTTTMFVHAAALAGLGRHQEAVAMCEQYESHVGVGQPSYDESVQLHATSLASLGHSDRAIAILTEAVDRSRQHGTARSLAMHLSKLGVVKFYQGHVVDAEPILREAFELYRESGDRAHEARVLNALAGVCGETGRLQEAGELLRLALDLSRRLGETETIFLLLSNLAQLLATVGQLGEAVQRADAAAAVGLRKGSRFVIPSWIIRAKVMTTIGAVAESALDVSRARGDELEPLYDAQLSLIEAENALLQGRHDEVRSLLNSARVVVEQIEAYDELVGHDLIAARLAISANDFLTAFEMSSRAADRARVLGLVAASVDARVLLAQASLESEPAVARDLAIVTLDAARDLSLREVVWRAHQVIAVATMRLNDTSSAVDSLGSCLTVFQEQCNELPAALADAYVAHPDRREVFRQLELFGKHERGRP